MIFSPPDLILIFLKVFFTTTEVGVLLITFFILTFLNSTPSSKKILSSI